MMPCASCVSRSAPIRTERYERLQHLIFLVNSIFSHARASAWTIKQIPRWTESTPTGTHYIFFPVNFLSTVITSANNNFSKHIINQIEQTPRIVRIQMPFETRPFKLCAEWKTTEKTRDNRDHNYYSIIDPRFCFYCFILVLCWLTSGE